jgi:hypothetical protein
MPSTRSKRYIPSQTRPQYSVNHTKSVEIRVGQILVGFPATREYNPNTDDVGVESRANHSRNCCLLTPFTLLSLQHTCVIPTSKDTFAKAFSVALLYRSTSAYFLVIQSNILKSQPLKTIVSEIHWESYKSLLI